MKLKLITPPTVEPVTVSEAEEHLEIIDPSQAGKVLGFVLTAREHVEHWTRRAVMTQMWEMFLDGFPRANYIELPFGNLQAGVVGATTYPTVKYKDTAGVETTMTLADDYIVETNGEGFGRIVLPYSVSWPCGPFYPSNPIAIRFVCGWTTPALVPAKIKHAIKLICADLEQGRGEPVIGQTVIENKTVERLLASYRLWGNFE